MKLRTLSLVALSLALAGSSSAFAAPITFTGTTTGVFSSSGTNVDGGLTFTASPFNGTTVNNFLSLTFGSFVDNGAIINPGNFLLNLTFTAPTGIVPSQTTSYNAVIQGAVSVVGGSVFISYSTPSQTFNSNSGPFTLFVNNVSVQANGGPVNESGSITTPNTVVTPEPSSLLLLGTGILGVAGVARRKFFTK